MSRQASRYLSRVFATMSAGSAGGGLDLSQPHAASQSRNHAKTLHRVKSIMNANRPGPARTDAAGLRRYLLASVERIEADDLTTLWQHQRRLVEIEQDIFGE